MAIALMFGKCFTENMNKDGSMPTNRFSKPWKLLARNGNVERSFNCKRFKAIRDFLTGRGLISWADRNYVISTEFDADGNGVNGKACKWCFSKELMEMLDFESSLVLKGERESIFIDTQLNTWKNQANWDLVEDEEICSPQQITLEHWFYLASQRLYDDPTLLYKQAA